MQHLWGQVLKLNSVDPYNTKFVILCKYKYVNLFFIQKEIVGMDEKIIIFSCQGKWQTLWGLLMRGL